MVNFTKTQHHNSYPFIDPTKANMTGKHVLITGASGGCGKAMALSYARAGASSIAILARRDLTQTAHEIEQAALSACRPKPKILTLKTDQTNQQQVEEAATQVKQQFGHLDVLVNNAGYLEAWRPMADSDPDDWWKTWEVNVKGTYLLCRALIPLLLQSEHKTIVQITSLGGLATGVGASAYQGTKTAIIRLSNHLRAEYGEKGLLVHNLHPGAVNTELAQGMPESLHKILIDEPELPGDTVVWLTRQRREWLQDRFVSSVWDMEEFEARKDEVVGRNLLRFKMDA